MEYESHFISACPLRHADSGFIPTFAYTFYGSSSQLDRCWPRGFCVTTNVECLAPLMDRPKEGRDEYTELAIQLAFMVGLLECSIQ